LCQNLSLINFCLNLQDKKKDDKKEDISLEDLIERERASLGSNLTPVTLDSFIAWKKRKISDKKAALMQQEEKKKSDFKAGKHYGVFYLYMIY